MYNNYNLLLKLVGFGNPQNAKIFFFGYEEKENNSGNTLNQLEKQRFNCYQEIANKTKEKFFWITNEELYLCNSELEVIDKVTANCNHTYSRYKNLYNNYLTVDERTIRENAEIGSKDLPLFVGNIYPSSSDKHENNNLTEKRIEILKDFFHFIKNKSGIKVFSSFYQK